MPENNTLMRFLIKQYLASNDENHLIMIDLLLSHRDYQPMTKKEGNHLLRLLVKIEPST